MASFVSSSIHRTWIADVPIALQGRPLSRNEQKRTLSTRLTNGVVYVASEDGNVYALRASTGAKLWSYATGTSVDSSPAVANGVVYVGSDYPANKVYALNASTGALLWSYTTGGGVNSSPAVANGVVYVGSLDNNVYALNASTGAKLWSYTTGGPIYYSSPAVVNGVVYVGSSDGNVYAFGLKKGQEKAGAVPALKTLHPDFNLKVSQPVATPSGTQ
jgi:outer membrane protein assembly factor BamB